MSSRPEPDGVTGVAVPGCEIGADAPPVTPSGSGLLDTLKQQDQKQAPSGPQVPRSQ